MGLLARLAEHPRGIGGEGVGLRGAEGVAVEDEDERGERPVLGSLEARDRRMTCVAGSMDDSLWFPDAVQIGCFR